MAIYRYQTGSLIDKMHILTNASGGERAYLHARADATPEQLAQIQTRINGMGWKSVPMIYDGQPMLEVRGFKKRDIAARQLAANGWVIGNPGIEAEEGDKRTGKEKAGKATLRLSGATYVFGDLMFYIYTGMQYRYHKARGESTSGAKFNIAAGIGYGLGSLALLFYGSRDQSQNVIQMTNRKINRYLQGEQIDVPSDTSLHATVRTEKRGFLGNINHTLAKYPSETLNALYVGVGAAISIASVLGARAARIRMKALIDPKLLKAQKREFNENALDLGLGIVTTVSAATGLLVKERKREPGEEKATGLGRIREWVQEKPLRATGIGYMVATGLHGAATIQKYRNEDALVRKTAVFRGMFAGANVVAEVLLALSSKGHGEGVKPDKSIDETVIASVAEVIHRQPAEKHASMVEQLAGYLASAEVLGGKADDIATTLRTHLQSLENNPWVGKIAMSTAPTLAIKDSSTPTLTMDTPGTKVKATQHVSQLGSAAQLGAAH